MTPIKVRVEGSVESAIRQFKRRCIDSGLFAEIKRVAFYEKPSEVRRRDQAKRKKTISRARPGSGSVDKKRTIRKPVRRGKPRR